jgi:hypothetical protein
MYILPGAGILSNLFVQAAGDTVGGTTVISVRLRATLEGALGSTGITCTLVDQGTFASCSDTVNTMAVVAGDVMSVEWSESAAVNNGRTTVSVRFSGN